MLGPAGRVQTAPSASVGDRATLEGRAALPWRALVVGALLLVALGAALYEGLAGGRSSVAPVAARSHGLSHEGVRSLPLAAHGPLASAPGAAQRAYRASAYAGGFRATNPAQFLSSSFSSSGVSVSSGATRVALSLRGVGYGSSLTAVSDVAPSVHGNRVLYARAGLSEWYVNGPLGLEQGFTVPAPPAAHRAGPLTLSMALSGNARASLAPDLQSITFSHAGAPSLGYSGLLATDARGHRLHSWLGLDGGRLLLRVDTSGARFPLRIDPGIAPTVVTEPASSVTHTSATLNATVNPNGETVTACEFEYGTSLPSGTTVPCTSRARVGRKPSRGVRVVDGPERKHQIPLPDHRDQQHGHQRRDCPKIHDAAPRGRNVHAAQLAVRRRQRACAGLRRRGRRILVLGS